MMIATAKAGTMRTVRPGLDPESMRTKICSAIRSRQLVRFYHRGQFFTIEPYCFGETFSGYKVLRGYITDGPCDRCPGGWTLFRVCDISLFSTTGDKFPFVRPGYNPFESVMKTVDCCV